MVMIIKQCFYLLFVLSIPFICPADAKVYKCLDGSGKVMYKNSPCSENEKSETVIKTDRSATEYDKDYYYENEDYTPQEKQTRNVVDIKKISSGERVNLNNYIVDDKVTAFLFYADWCRACEQIRPGIEKMARNSDNFILRKIDITEFESPVTNQYQIKSIPYFFIYDENGNLAVQGSKNRAINYLNNNI